MITRNSNSDDSSEVTEALELPPMRPYTCINVRHTHCVRSIFERSKEDTCKIELWNGSISERERERERERKREKDESENERKETKYTRELRDER